MKKSKMKILTDVITFFVGITFAYFIWLTWNKLTQLIGNSDLVWLITGAIVLLGIVTGYLSWKKVRGRFG